MGQIIDDQLVVMEFPITGGVKANRNDVVRALLERRQDIENTFKNNEFLKLDLTHQELVGVKSTSYLGKMPIGDLSALNYLIDKNDKYKDCEITNIGNVNTVYDYFSA